MQADEKKLRPDQSALSRRFGAEAARNRTRPCLHGLAPVGSDSRNHPKPLAPQNRFCSSAAFPLLRLPQRGETDEG
jgi:hypothetical protein